MKPQAVSLNLFVKNPDEEVNLVEKAVGGDKDSYKELFTKNVSKIYSFCLRISSDVHTAEELTQEVFIKAWEKLNTFQFQSKFSSWLHGIAVNQFMMHLRASNSYNQRNEQFSRQNSDNEHGQTQDARIDLEKAITKLPEQAKAVLILHDIEGYKHNEISSMMSIEIGTSKAHLHRARKILREELSK